LDAHLLSTPRKNLAFEQGIDTMITRHLLEYDSVALAALFIGIGVVELLVLSI
jgi:hypothetical protein